MSRCIRCVLLLLATSAVFVAELRLYAQATKHRFEVVSIKPREDPRLRGADAFRQGLRPGGTFVWNGFAVAGLISYAYDLKPYQLVGGPDWIRSDTFDIDARAGRDISEAEVRVLLQSLLEDRLQLVSHTESREMRFRALVLAHNDGRLGPYIRRVGESCAKTEIAEAQKQFPPRTLDPDAPGGTMSGGCVELSSMVLMMSLDAEVPVLDKTGLTGKFTYDLRYAGSGIKTSSGEFADALEEQLGLKLRDDRGPVVVRVVDSVQRPSEN